MKKQSSIHHLLIAAILGIAPLTAFPADAGSIYTSWSGIAVEGSTVYLNAGYYDACTTGGCQRVNQNITVYWGDGTSGNHGGDTSYSVPHVYSAPGTYGVTVVGYTTCGGFFCNTNDHAGGGATITVAAAALSGTGGAFVASAGAVYDGPVASLQDSNPYRQASDVSATINWGDGTSSPGRLVSRGNGQFDVYGTHLFATPGTYSVTVSALSTVGSTATATSQAVVGNCLKPSLALQSTTFATGREPESIQIGDFDEDGILDLVVANYASAAGNTTSFLRGTGGGQFGAPVSLASGLGPLSLAVADLDNDGHLDLAVANAYSNSISILLGDGHGSFTAAAEVPTGTIPEWVVTGDFDHDGKLDLAVVTPGQVLVHRGLGGGAFAAGAAYSVGAYAIPATVADFNGDGNLDLAVSNRGDETISILLGNGTGGFTTQTLSAPGCHTLMSAAADLNGDGKTDLVVQCLGREARILLGNGDGTFAAGVSLPLGDTPNGVALADVTGDGKPDVIAVNFISNDLYVYPGKGDGTFFQATILPVGSRPTGVVAADLDGDGKPDLAIPSDDQDSVSVYLNTNCKSVKLATSSPGSCSGPGSPLAPAVAVSLVDDGGNVAYCSSGTISASIEPGTGTVGAALGGTTTRTAVAGIATFSDLTISLSGAGYQLDFAGGSAGTVRTAAFNVINALNLAPATLPTGLTGVTYASGAITASGGTPSYAFALTGTLPSGLAFSSDATHASIDGMTTQKGNFPISVRVTDSNSCASTISYVLAVSPSITVTSPNTAVTWRIGDNRAITFTHILGAGKIFLIELTRDGGSTWVTLNPSFAAGAASGSLPWIVTGPLTNAARVRVSWTGNPPATDTSDNSFTIVDRITVTAPNTAVNWAQGTVRTITWTHNLPATEKVNIDLSTDSGVTFPTSIATNVPVTPATFSWTVPAVNTSTARIRVSWAANPADNDVSDVNFTIAAPFVAVTSPNTAVTWRIGDNRNITFNHNLGIGQVVNIDISRNGGGSFTPVGPFTTMSATTGSFPWVVTGPLSTQTRVRLTWASGTTVTSTSAVDFTILDRITVTSPNAALNWAVGTTRAVTWNHNLGTSASVAIEVSRDGGSNWSAIATVPNTTATTGTYNWVVTGPATTLGRIRVSWAANPANNDISDVSFTIGAPTITITSPNAAVTWRIGDNRNITFNHNLGVGQVVNIDISRDGGTSFTPIGPFTTTTATTGSFPWVVTGPLSTQARVRLTWASDATVTSTSAVNYTIIDRITVTAPNMALSWAAETVHPITWTHNLPAGQSVNLEVSRDGGSNWSAIATVLATPSTYNWTVTGPLSTTCLIRVSWAANPANNDISNVNFIIAAPTVSITSPNTAVTWRIGDNRNITFNHNLGIGQVVNIDISRDGGTMWGAVTAFTTTAATTGSFPWVVTGPLATQARVRLTWATDVTVTSTSAVNFTIIDRITVTAPNTAVTWTAKTVHPITWTHNLSAGESVNLEVSRDGGSTWGAIATVLATPSTYNWTVTGPASTTCLIRVSLVANPANNDVSDAAFTIAAPFVTVISPNTAVTWRIGDVRNITFNHNLGIGQVVNIDVSRDGGTTWGLVTAFTTASATTGSYPWTLTGATAPLAKVRLTWASDATVISTSAVNFTIIDRITVTSPNTVVTWTTGTIHPVTWTHNLPAGENVIIEVSRDGGSTWSAIATVLATPSTYSWTVTGPATTQAKIRVSWAANPSNSDISDVNFKIN
jgi:hypothetical protein